MSIQSSSSEENKYNNEITKKLLYLCNSITNIAEVLINLEQEGIISDSESEIISDINPSIIQNRKLLVLLKRKDWSRIRSKFIQILRTTSNHHCADTIENTDSVVVACETVHHVDPTCFVREPETQTIPFQTRLLSITRNCTDLTPESPANNLNEKIVIDKWWPEKKILPNSFYERKSDEGLLVTKLKRILTTDNADSTTVITQKLTVSGLGGIGKTTIAKSFAIYYEKEYDHILWIDCGEGSLLKSFAKLAKDLKVGNLSDNGLHDLAEESFKILKPSKCLFIYDNAERYVGDEGIRKVLPKNCDNFHTIITSRHREWGNRNGDGVIPQFDLNVFEANESVEFLNVNLADCPDKDKNKLETLCNLLGHLPLALQISVATINRRKMYLIDYINKIQDTPHIINTPFDDYETTINKTMKISLKMIEKNENNQGGLAYRIITTFGYITPDDVPCKFFKSVEDTKQTEIDEATDLLECYSLITKKNISPQKKTFSIHRLLQQVVRHNGEETKSETLTRILNCKGLWEFKLIPFSYADENLKLKFLHIRDELLDKVGLNELLKSKRFQESVELSRLISDAKGTPVSRFNYAVCLKYNFQIEEAKLLLQDLYDSVQIKSEYIKKYDVNKLGIISGSRILPREVVAGQLFLIYASELDPYSSAIVLESGNVIVPLVSLNELFSALNFIILNNCIVVRFYGNKRAELNLQNNNFNNTLELISFTVTAETQISTNVQRLVLSDSKLTGWDINALSSLTIKNSKVFLNKVDLLQSATKTNEHKSHCILQKILDLENIKQLDINNLRLTYYNPYKENENQYLLVKYVTQLLFSNNIPYFFLHVTNFVNISLSSHNDKHKRSMEFHQFTFSLSLEFLFSWHILELGCITINQSNLEIKSSEILQLVPASNEMSNIHLISTILDLTCVKELKTETLSVYVVGSKSEKSNKKENQLLVKYLFGWLLSNNISYFSMKIGNVVNITMSSNIKQASRTIEFSQFAFSIDFRFSQGWSTLNLKSVTIKYGEVYITAAEVLSLSLERLSVESKMNFIAKRLLHVESIEDLEIENLSIIIVEDECISKTNQDKNADILIQHLIEWLILNKIPFFSLHLCDIIIISLSTRIVEFGRTMYFSKLAFHKHLRLPLYLNTLVTLSTFSDIEKVEKISLKMDYFFDSNDFQINSKGAMLFTAKMSMKPIIEFLKLLPRFSYHLLINGTEKCLNLTIHRNECLSQVQKIVFINSIVDSGTQFTDDLQELELTNVELLTPIKAVIQQIALKNMKVDTTLSLNVNELILDNVELIDLSTAAWEIKKLVVRNMHFKVRLEMTVTEMTFACSPLFPFLIDISVLPNSLNKLTVVGYELLTVSDTLDTQLLFPTNMHEMQLFDVRIKGEKKNELTDISYLIPSNLQLLTLKSFQDSRCSVSLNSVHAIQSLVLQESSLIINPNIRIYPKELTLVNVTFIDENGKIIPSIRANDFIDFNEIQKLWLDSNKGLSLVNCDISTIQEVYIPQGKFDQYYPM